MMKNKILNLFLIFFKIGGFTFGGGYAMIPLVKEECIEKNHFVTEDEFYNLIAVAESTPGPIAINMATYVGYKTSGLIGAISATVGVALPSIICICIVSYYIDFWLNNEIIKKAFFGIRIAVALIIINTSINLFKACIKKDNNLIYYLLFLLYTIIILVSEYFSLNISFIMLVLIAIFLGIIVTCAKQMINKNDKN